MQTIQLLAACYPGRVSVTMGEALQALTQRRYSDAEQAAYTLASRGRYPIPTVAILGRRLVRLQDLADFIDLLGTGAPAPAAPASPARSPAPRRPGRPRRTASTTPAGTKAGGDV